MSVKKYFRGFTLIELLLVISIISLLSSIVLSGINKARANARDARRLADIIEVEKALALYFDKYGKYPVNKNSPGGSVYATWLGTTPNCYSYTGTRVVAEGMTEFISQIPRDPKPPNNTYCYLYYAPATGADYKFLVYNTVETFNPQTKGHTRRDPRGRANSFAVYSPGGANF